MVDRPMVMVITADGAAISEIIITTNTMITAVMVMAMGTGMAGEIAMAMDSNIITMTLITGRVAAMVITMITMSMTITATMKATSVPLL